MSEIPSELNTINADGTRRWVHPRIANGKFLRRRRVVAYALIVMFVSLPFININGRPAFLIDLLTREISLFGARFRPSDGMLLMLLGLAIVLTVFFVTALFGRVWCGWACPQTVYLEFVFRPLDRLFEGSVSQQRKLDGKLAPRRILKWIVYLGIAFVLANVFLAYFVGISRLQTWVFHAPGENLGGFFVVLGVTAMMWFDFAIFREQTCIVACPYGRLQSVLLDSQSLIVGYDAARGEPRVKPGHKSLRVISEETVAPGAPRTSDCVDCGACVAVCPTGIDIRQGLQMECIGCAQCIDACEPVMQKLGRPTGLIRYTSEDELAGKPRSLLRLRTFIYPVLIVTVVVMLVVMTRGRASTELWVERVDGTAFVDLTGGHIGAQARLAIENRSAVAATYVLALVDAPDATLRGSTTWTLRAAQRMTVSMMIDVPATSFVNGRREVQLRVTDGDGFDQTVTVPLLGPDHGATP